MGPNGGWKLTKNMVAGAKAWPRVPNVSENGVRDFTTQGKLLQASQLAATHRENTLWPIKIV
jgi:hypothetical protein